MGLLWYDLQGILDRDREKNRFQVVIAIIPFMQNSQPDIDLTVWKADHILCFGKYRRSMTLLPAIDFIPDRNGTDIILAFENFVQ